jgi:hypothetical protein
MSRTIALLSCFLFFVLISGCGDSSDQKKPNMPANTNSSELNPQRGELYDVLKDTVSFKDFSPGTPISKLPVQMAN